jgi:hypothetical protein
MKNKTVLSLIACLGLAAVVVLPGCQATLESGGAYAPIITNSVTGAVTLAQEPELAFYNVDAAYNLAYSTVDAAFNFERNNRALLWQISPGIKHSLDVIRPQAVSANLRYLAARSAYLANPVPAGLTQLQTVLAEVASLASAAQAAIAVQAPAVK